MSNESKTHFRKAFDLPYLSSADIVEPTILTIARVSLETDKTKKTKDVFNTAYFVERELRPGEKLKPMILKWRACESAPKHRSLHSSPRTTPVIGPTPRAPINAMGT